MDLEAKLKHMVSKAIKIFSMFTRNDRLLVAASGGKDSLALAIILKKLNFNIECIFIDLGIPAFSKNSRDKINLFCKKHSIPLYIIELKKELSISITEISGKYPENICAACGSIKRKILNSYCIKHQFDILITGHHMDDELENLLADNLRWDWSYMKKAVPFKKGKKGFISRAKPLCFCREREIQDYVTFSEIDFVKESCPFSKKGSRNKYRKILKSMERVFPNITSQYYQNFLKNHAFLETFQEKELLLKQCKECGDWSSHEICRVCQIINGIWRR